MDAEAPGGKRKHEARGPQLHGDPAYVRKAPRFCVQSSPAAGGQGRAFSFIPIKDDTYMLDQ